MLCRQLFSIDRLCKEKKRRFWIKVNLMFQTLNSIINCIEQVILVLAVGEVKFFITTIKN